MKKAIVMICAMMSIMAMNAQSGLSLTGGVSLSTPSTEGAQLGVQLDFRKLFFTLDYRHSFIRSQLNCNGFENTLQLGIGYRL
jgi:hypothetical protein